MDLEPRLLRYFLAVAQELHFGRAAARLYISQPSLSDQIHNLERTLGTDLFVRNSRQWSILWPARVQSEATARFLEGYQKLSSASFRGSPSNCW